MGRDTDYTERLRRELVRAVIDGTGMQEQVALPIANSVLAYLQTVYPGQRVYVPAPARQHDVMQIHAALRAGRSMKEVCREHSISVRTLQRLFPGGIPGPSKVG